MNFTIEVMNELPFMLEIPNGKYKVKTTNCEVEIYINSDLYKLYVARFPEYAENKKYIGDKEELEQIIETKNISNYAFAKCKTFVSTEFSSEKVFSEEDYSSVSDEQCIEWIKTEIIKQRRTDEDISKTSEIFNNYRAEEKKKIKTKVLIENEFSKLNKLDEYYEALNTIIKQYSYLRKHFWVYLIDANSLDGTNVNYYLDGKYYSNIIKAGSIASIFPYERKFLDISENEKKEFERKLSENSPIPIEEELLLVAHSLCYRLEYRAAIIESSAALEIAVERKLIEKMKLLDKEDDFINNELEKTKLNFNQRCDHFLKKYTDKSFVTDNAELWNIIDAHRKNFRNNIVHSDLIPNKTDTENIINDFEKAIKYISNL